MPQDSTFVAARFDERYGRDEFAFGEEPNDFLAEHAGAIPAGPVLCLAEGEAERRHLGEEADDRWAGQEAGVADGRHRGEGRAGGNAGHTARRADRDRKARRQAASRACRPARP